MTPEQAEAFLLALPRFDDAGAAAYAPGFGRIRALLAAMGDPHAGLPVVHVAGTNGKGSTSSFAAAIGTASRLRVGLHTSPFLLSLHEQMRVDGAPVSPEWVAGAVARFEVAIRETGPSYFEAILALSLLYFREQGVDLAVVEVGLGGRLDATNVVEPVACLVTHIGLDHTDLLGDTRAAIAREKAGIAKPGVPLLHAVDDAEARAALEDEARRRGATVEAVRETVRLGHAGDRVEIGTEVGTVGSVRLGLAGEHQAWNAALAVRAAEVARPGLAREAAARGLREVAALAGLRGRGERWAADPRVVLDVAHNPDGWRAALDALDLPEGGALWALVGAMADKDVRALADLLARRGARALVLGFDAPRALPAADLARLVAEAGGVAEPVAGAAEALSRFRQAAGAQDRLLVTGSHKTVAEALTVLEAAPR